MRKNSEQIATAAEQKKDRYAETERRLFRMPELIQRIEYNREDLREIKEGDFRKLSSTSASIVKLIRPGMRLDPIEAQQAQIELLEAYIAADKLEVCLLKRALSCVRKDPYFLTIEYKYFRRLPDAEAAISLNCALTTVRRNRAGLVRRIAVLLYGVYA